MVRYINGKITTRNDPIDYLCFYRPIKSVISSYGFSKLK